MNVRILSNLAAVAATLSACQTRTPTQMRPDTLAPSHAVERNVIVARLNGEAITAGQLDDSLKGGMIRTEIEYLQKRYELRSQGLDKILDDRLIAAKAKALGITVPQLVEKEVTAKVAIPSDAEQHELYDQAQAAGKQLPPYEQIKDELVAFIRERKTESALEAYYGQLRAEAKIEKLLGPLLLPKIAVDAIGPAQGPADAPITIIEFSDYECPFCGRVEPTVQQVLQRYKGKVRLVYREFPLGMHEHAQKASEAALCAHDQGKFWEMHAKLFDNQRHLSTDELKGYAKGIELDTARFETCLDSAEKANDVAASQRAGEEVGVSGTPAFFINGRPLFGAMPVERFIEIIDAELQSGVTKM